MNKPTFLIVIYLLFKPLAMKFKIYL